MRVRPLLTSNSSSQRQVDSVLWKVLGTRVQGLASTYKRSLWLAQAEKEKNKGQLTNLQIFVVICLSVRLRDVIQELKQRRFLSGAHQPEVVFFAFFGSGFAHIFAQIVFIYVKTLRYTNLVASSHTKRNKASVSVDVRRSKKSLLKLPIYPLVPGKKTVSAFA